MRVRARAVAQFYASAAKNCSRLYGSSNCRVPPVFFRAFLVAVGVGPLTFILGTSNLANCCVLGYEVADSSPLGLVEHDGKLVEPSLRSPDARQDVFEVLRPERAGCCLLEEK